MARGGAREALCAHAWWCGDGCGVADGVGPRGRGHCLVLWDAVVLGSCVCLCVVIMVVRVCVCVCVCVWLCE